MAWKDGFVIEYVDREARISCYKCRHFVLDGKYCTKARKYVGDVARRRWRTCKWFALAPDFNTVEMREFADRDRARAYNKKQSKKRNAEKKAEDAKKEQPVGSVLTVKGLHVGRIVRDRQGNSGYVKSLTSTTATIQFDNGTTKRYRIPEDFTDGVIRIQSKGVSKTNKAAEPTKEQKARLERFVGYKAYSPTYGLGTVVGTEGRQIVVAFSQGAKRVLFDPANALRDGRLKLDRDGKSLKKYAEASLRRGSEYAGGNNAKALEKRNKRRFGEPKRR